MASRTSVPRTVTFVQPPKKEKKQRGRENDVPANDPSKTDKPAKRGHENDVPANPSKKNKPAAPETAKKKVPSAASSKELSIDGKTLVRDLRTGWYLYKVENEDDGQFFPKDKAPLMATKVQYTDYNKGSNGNITSVVVRHKEDGRMVKKAGPFRVDGELSAKQIIEKVDECTRASKHIPKKDKRYYFPNKNELGFERTNEDMYIHFEASKQQWVAQVPGHMVGSTSRQVVLGKFDTEAEAKKKRKEEIGF